MVGLSHFCLIVLFSVEKSNRVLAHYFTIVTKYQKIDRISFSNDFKNYALRKMSDRMIFYRCISMQSKFIYKFPLFSIDDFLYFLVHQNHFLKFVVKKTKMSALMERKLLNFIKTAQKG